MPDPRFIKFIMIISIAVSLASPAVEMRSVFAGVAVDCEGSAKAYAAQGIPCTCKGGRIVCDQSSGGRSYSSSSKKKGLSSKNTMKLQILQGAMDSFANAFIKWINTPPNQAKAGSAGPTSEQIATGQRAYAEWQAKVQKQIGEMESRYREMERQKTNESKNRLLAGMKGMDRSSSGQPSTAMEQLQRESCKAYWAKKAAEASAAGDEKSALKYSQLGQNPDAAAIAECSRSQPQPPTPPSPDEFRIELFETVVDELNQRFPMLEQAKKKQQEMAVIVAEKQKVADGLKEKNMAVRSPEEKKESYDLMIAALKELEDATAQKKEADAGVIKLELEINALNEIGKMAAGAQQ